MTWSPDLHNCKIVADEVEPQNNTIIEEDNSQENFEETNNEISSKEDLVEEITKFKL